MSQFDDGLTIGIILGKKMAGGGGGGCDPGKTQLELAIIDVGGVVIKVGAIPTFDELETGIYSILESIPMKFATITDTIDISTRANALTDDIVAELLTVIRDTLEDTITGIATITDDIIVALV